MGRTVLPRLPRSHDAFRLSCNLPDVVVRPTMRRMRVRPTCLWMCDVVCCGVCGCVVCTRMLAGWVGRWIADGLDNRQLCDWTERMARK